MAITAGTRLGHYEIVAPLGAGGMGAVYLAQDLRLGRKVAVKVLPVEFTEDADRVRRFEQEARAASALNHPNIVTIYEIGEAGGERFIAMEYIQGRTLRATIDEGPALEALPALGSQMAKALGVAHAAGIVHRDIKPENIVVRDDGYVKVLDFGVASLSRNVTDPEENTYAPTATDTLVGTVRYMSPEQVRRETVTSAADVFALGIVFYELATRRHPFIANSPIETLHLILGQAPLIPSRLNPEVSADTEALILQMLEKDVRQRPSAADVVAALEQSLGRPIGGERKSRATPRTERRTVGRQQERDDLRAALGSVTAKRGLLVSVSGEPGIGKTTIVEDFLADVQASDQPYPIGRGRSSERLASTEVYLPILEALDNLLRGPDRDAAAHVMKALAPTWYLQIAPGSADESSITRALADTRAGSQERMKRELGAFLEEITRVRPVILFFDDLHWADLSTVDMLAYVASRFDAIRVLIVVTYRPSDMLLVKHPFLQVRPNLLAHGDCREIALGFLDQRDIDRYLSLEFPGHRFPPEFTALIQARTDGNPLFMADLVRYLRDRQVIVEEQGRWVLAPTVQDIERDLPESVRTLIQRKIDQLSENDRRLMLAASVQGSSFDSAVTSKALAMDPAVVEERLEVLDRIYALVRIVDEKEFPDGTPTLRYRFVHVLYQNALYASLGPTRRAALSREVAQALLGYYGDHSGAVAAELAYLLEAARDGSRAAEYFLLAARNAAQVFANAEAAILARRGLKLLQTLPDTPDRMRAELQLQVTLGFALASTKGYADPETGKSMARAREICEHSGETPELFPIIWGLFTFYIVRAEFQTARQFGEQLLRLGVSANDTILQVGGHYALGTSAYLVGEIVTGHEHYERVLGLYDPQQHRAYRALYRRDPGVYSRSGIVRTLWLLGYPDQAARRLAEALALAQQVADPGSRAFALTFPVYLNQLCRDPVKTEERADACIAECQAHGIAQERLWASVVRGWALVQQGRVEEGLAEIRQNLARLGVERGEVFRPYFLALLAESLGKAGQVEAGLTTIGEALDAAHRTGERYYESELCRLKGELLLGRADAAASAEAEACFREAIAIAHQQAAKSLELRAAVSLSKLYRSEQKPADAHQTLSDVYGWFTEGFETADLKEAGALLKEVSGTVISSSSS